VPIKTQLNPLIPMWIEFFFKKTVGTLNPEKWPNYTHTISLPESYLIVTQVFRPLYNTKSLQ